MFWLFESAGAEFAFESTTAGPESIVVSVTVCSTETFPCNAGIDIKNAETMKTEAATIVIFESIDAVPRGPKAALETLLVNNAPASVFPG